MCAFKSIQQWWNCFWGLSDILKNYSFHWHFFPLPFDGWSKEEKVPRALYRWTPRFINSPNSDVFLWFFWTTYVRRNIFSPTDFAQIAVSRDRAFQTSRWSWFSCFHGSNDLRVRVIFRFACSLQIVYVSFICPRKKGRLDSRIDTVS